MIQDLKFALRWLRKSPAFAVVAILSLGLGVGANAAMFSLVDALLLRPLPVANPGELVDVFTSSSDGDIHATSSYPDFTDLRARNAVFTDMIGYSPMFAAMSFGDRSRLVLGQVVTANHFQVLGIAPGMGRLLQPADDAPGAERVVVVSHRMWVREFSSAPDIVGRTVQLRGQPFTIVGVAPASFGGVVPLLTPELWLPIAHVEDVEPAGIQDAVPGPGTTRLDRRGARWMFVKGRLKPGVTADQAHANMQVLGAQLEAEYPATNKERRLSAIPTSDVRMFVPEAGGPMTMGAVGVMAAVGLVLLIACANVAGLLVARASAREREMSIRAAIGASRGRLARQLLVEGAVLGLAGVAVAIAIAWAVTRALVTIELPIPDVPVDLRVDGRVLIFATVVALVSGLLASVSPALRASSASLVSALRGPATNGASAVRRWGVREVLVSAQVAFTVVLLVVAGLLLRSLGVSRAADVGFDTRGLALLAFDTDMVRYTPERGRQFWQDAMARVRALPEVRSVGLATPRVPFEINYGTNEIRIGDRTYAEGERGEILHNVSVSEDYFTALGVPVIRGRGFAAADREGAPLVAIVNDAMARKYWPDGSAVGRTIIMAATGRRYEIVGVSADYRVRTVGEAPTPYVHFAAAQRPQTYNAMLIRARGNADDALNAARRELVAMEPRLVFVHQSTMERTFAATLLPARLGATLAASFSALGTLLAAIGLYGAIAFAVSRRAQEIGIRVALGATRRDVLRMVLRQGGLIVLAGTLVGAGLAALAAGVLGQALYGVHAGDPSTWLGALLIVGVAAAAAHTVPALRALRVDPARTLRT